MISLFFSMRRLFIALLPNDSTRAELAMICSGINGAKWTPPEQLHCTVRFLGNVADDRAVEIEAALHEVRMQPLVVRISGVGTFPAADRRAQNVLWVGVETTPELHELQQRVDDSLEMIGMRRESRPYHAHITVARIRYADPIGLEDWLSTHAKHSIAPFTADQFVLMESSPGADGSDYAVVRRYSTHDGDD